MKKISVVLFTMGIIMSSCQKYEITLVDNRPYPPTSDIVIRKDTTINDVWTIPSTTLVRFETGGHISGNGTIRGGIIQASLNQNLFDTTIKLEGIKLYNHDFSIMWFGANPDNVDNYLNIQKSLDVCIANALSRCFVPKGRYKYSRSLKIQNIYKGAYVGAAVRFYGEGQYWDEKSILTYEGLTGFALGIQVGKGTEIDHLKIEGQFLAPTTNGADYYNTPLESFGTNTGNSGIVIDFDGSKGGSGSTGIKVHDTWVTNFEVLYSVSPNGVTYNADILVFENIRCGVGRIGFQSGQAQEKGNIIRGIYSWERIHTLVSIGQSGKYQAGHYTIDGGNIAGACIRLFDIRQSGWYPTSISNIFAESLATIGNISAGDSQNKLPTSISKSVFHFLYAASIGSHVLLSVNHHSIKFDDCLFRYYGSQEPMRMNGWGTFQNCSFSGPVVNIYNGFTYL